MIYLRIWPLQGKLMNKMFIQLWSGNRLLSGIIQTDKITGWCSAQVRYSQSKFNENVDHQVESRSLYAPAECAVPMCWSSRYSFIGHQILIICIFSRNVFAYQISLQSNKSYLVRLSFCCCCYKVYEEFDGLHNFQFAIVQCKVFIGYIKPNNSVPVPYIEIFRTVQKLLDFPFHKFLVIMVFKEYMDNDCYITH